MILLQLLNDLPQYRKTSHNLKDLVQVWACKRHIPMDCVQVICTMLRDLSNNPSTILKQVNIPITSADIVGLPDPWALMPSNQVYYHFHYSFNDDTGCVDVYSEFDSDPYCSVPLHEIIKSDDITTISIKLGLIQLQLLKKTDMLEYICPILPVMQIH
jgi:hypothetical protein